ncbi:MAG TPA: amidase family protein [Vicinamibacterales bacterium]|nr:amidase family protein [Vicinamibacterales bacterium]
MIRLLLGGVIGASLISAITPASLFERPPGTASTFVVRAAADEQAPFDPYEKSIGELQTALEKGQTTSRQLVESYLARIDAYEQQGPRINAFIALNPAALETADALDAERKARKVRGPLHGIPIVIKDNFDTADMPTTGSSIALATHRPVRDAFQVARLRAAGAIVVGKTNLHELASGIVTVSSLGAQTRNPYDPTRNPGGSSGGTGAAIAANFAAAGLGTDTCGSIRIPASHNSLVGLRPTYGLTSRAGVIPLSHTQDVAGPLARSVRDVALILDATVGIDPDDPVSAAGRGRAPRSYVDGLAAASLKGTRLGVLMPLFGDAPEDGEVGGIVRASLDTAKQHGAAVVEMPMPNLTELLRATSVIDAEFKFDLSDYLSAASAPPVRSLGEILDRGLYHQALDGSFRRRNAIESRDSESYRTSLARREEARKAILGEMDAARVTAIVYPTLRRKAAPIGESQAGTNCQLSPTTGLPALSVPAGFTPDGLPVGIEFVGRAFSEPDLLKLGAAFERATHAHRPPASTPPLGDPRASPPAVALGTLSPPVVSSSSPVVRTRFRQPSPNVLSYEIAVDGVTAQDMLLVGLHRAAPPAPPGSPASPAQAGFVIARFLRTGELAGSGEIALREADREDLAAGRLFLRLFTRQQPLGAGQFPLTLTFR